MLKHNFDDTIAAIATAIGRSGIGIVRISGKDALEAADKIFRAKDGKKPSAFGTYTTHYGWIVSGDMGQGTGAGAEREIIDEVLLTVMRAPKSYTKEDVVEINCHGGVATLRRVLDLVLESGCRLAEPGEFTRRAFLNGRIDLAQAEAVLDVIKAKTDSALKLGVAQLKGELSAQVNTIRGMLLEALTFMEANIDFPDEELEAVDLRKVIIQLNLASRKLAGILKAARQGRILRDGVKVVICGKPNVGKSSLLNAILKQERAIVSHIAGTTRDTIEEPLDIEGIPVSLVDTAGIIEPRGLIEKKAILRSKKSVESADLVILLFDASKRLNKQDYILMKQLEKKRVLAVVNKIDLKLKIDRSVLKSRYGVIVDACAKTSGNIELVCNEIARLIFHGEVCAPESIVVSNARHMHKMRQAQKLIAAGLISLDNKLSLEFVSQEIKDALGYLDDILGKRFSEDLLDRIFGEFCIGK
jgi:tRNA modification GTPase